MIERTKRINLDKYDPTWKDCYIIIRTRGFTDSMDYQKAYFKIEKRTEQNSRLLTKISNKIKREDDETELEVLYKEEEKLKEEDQKLQVELMNFLANSIKSRFKSGLIFHVDLKATKEMTATDIEAFDMEVLKDILNSLFGNLEKKL